MRLFLGGLAFVLAGTFQVVAQTGSSTPGTGPARGPLGVWEAPIGHRQPTAESVKRAESSHGGKNESSKPPKSGVNIDKDLTICRGC